jgi:hypothetical protein
MKLSRSYAPKRIEEGQKQVFYVLFKGTQCHEMEILRSKHFNQFFLCMR